MGCFLPRSKPAERKNEDSIKSPEVSDGSEASSTRDYYEITKFVNEKLGGPRASASTSTNTTTSFSTDVVIELPGGSIALSRSEYRELFVKVNGFRGAKGELILMLSPRLRQAFPALYKYGIIYYDPLCSAWRVSISRLLKRVRVLTAPVDVLRFYLPKQPAAVAQPVAPATQLQQAMQVEEVEVAEAGEEFEGEGKEEVPRKKKLRLTKPIAYPGGDWPLKDVIIDLLVRSGCTTLVEVFGGSGVISMYAPRSVFKNIVYNDIDKLLVNFFTVLRERPRELMERVMQMPAARELVEKYIDMIRSGEIHKIRDPVEKAAIYFYVNRLTFNSELHSFKVLVSGSAAKRLRNQAMLLPEYAKMWSDVTIENKDFRELIELYDRSYTVFYCDPPFLTVEGATKGEREKYYLHSFTEQDMKDLLKILSSIEGKFVLKLPKDHLGIPFIKSWVKEHNYSIRAVEHAKQMVNIIGGKREKQVTVFIYNYT